MVPLGERPDGAVVVKSNAPIRTQYKILAVGFVGATVGVGAVLTFLFGPLARPDFTTYAVLMLVSLPPFAIIAWIGFHFRDRAVDFEIAPGQIRLPFGKHRERGGWRDAREIHFMAQHATVQAISAANEIVDKLRVPKTEAKWNKTLVRGWANTRLLLVMTDDEVLFLSGETAMFDQIISHWDAEKRRLVAVAPEPGPGETPRS